MNSITYISHKKKSHISKNNKISGFFSKILMSIIVVLSSLIFTNLSEKNYLLYKDNVIDNNIKLTKIRNKYEKLFGKIITKKTSDVKTVFSENNLDYKIEPYLEGEKIVYNSKSNVQSLQSGIVVFIGDKENLGNTIIIQGVDDTDVWYSNISNSSVKLYDYIEKGKILGEVEDTLYLNIIKDKQHLKYNEYAKSI